MVARAGRRASFDIGYLTGIELRGAVVMFCRWLLLWAGPGARAAAQVLLANSLRWQQVEAGNAEVSISLIRSTLYILSYEANLLHRWVSASGVRPRACCDPCAFLLQARHSFMIGNRCIAQLIAGVCNLQRPCIHCACILDCIPDVIHLPSCMSQGTYAAMRSDRGLHLEEVWKRIEM